MRCPYCLGQVVGDMQVLMIAGEGPAHINCHKNHQIVTGERSFMGLHFPSMNLDDLYEMKELLLMELNVRERCSMSEEGAIELFA